MPDNILGDSALYAAGGLAGYRFDGVEKYTIGLRKETTEGYPTAPCMALDYANTQHTFRWGVASGTRTLSIYAKQVSNVTGQRPRVVIKSNASIGVNSDTVGNAGAGTGWVQIGPLTVTPTTAGVLEVELWNMDTTTYPVTPAYFDSIERT